MKNFGRFLRSYLSGYSLEKRSSSLNPFLEVVYVNGGLRLNSRTLSYSFSGTYAVFNKAFRKFNISGKKISSSLILGFGAGNTASVLQNEHKVTGRMVGVEADKVVIELAEKYFGLDAIKNLELHCADAHAFVLKCREKFDLIAMDIFIDKYVPDKFHQLDFVERLARLLSDQGILFLNYISFDDRTENGMQKLKAAFKALPGRTSYHPVSFLGIGNIIIVYEKSGG